MKKRDFNKNLIGLAAFFGLASTGPKEEKKVCRHGVRHDNPEDSTFIDRSDNLYDSVKESHIVNTEFIIKGYYGGNSYELILDAADVLLSSETERLDVTQWGDECSRFIDGNRSYSIGVTIGMSDGVTENILFDMHTGSKLLKYEWKYKGLTYECQGYITSVSGKANEIAMDIVVSGAVTTKAI